MSAMKIEEALAAIREAQMHMQGKFNSPGAREITDGRLDALRAHVESQAARVAELEGENRNLREKVKWLEAYRDFVVGEGVWERWLPLEQRAQSAEAKVAELEAGIGRLIAELEAPRADDECTLYTMGKRAGRHEAVAKMDALLRGEGE